MAILWPVRVVRGIIYAAGMGLLLASCASSPAAGLGVMHGALAPCPSSPNCVCSEASERSTSIAPLKFTEDPTRAWISAQAAITSLGGKIEKLEDAYLWASFQSKIFRFVDDLELRLDGDQKVIHVRSAARMGYSDFGVNAARVEALRAEFSRRSAQSH